MVGLSIVLESADKVTTTSSTNNNNKSAQRVINKVISIKNKPTPSASSWFCGGSFLDHCFLCRRRLLPSTDIYMYLGDRAFCSEECRCNQIFMDEYQIQMNKRTTSYPTTTTTATKTATPNREKCSLAAIRSSATSSPPSSSRKST